MSTSLLDLNWIIIKYNDNIPNYEINDGSESIQKHN